MALTYPRKLRKSVYKETNDNTHKMGDRVYNNFLVWLATTYDKDRGSLIVYFA